MAKQPNLIFIWTDQQRYDTLGAYGNHIVETPNVDALADAGTKFEEAYVTQPLCGPSRSSVMTGLFPHTTGLVTNNVPFLRESDRCLPELGSFSDYHSAWIGKWHLGDEVFRQHGFDEWISTEDCYREFYQDTRDDTVHSDYHHYLVEQGFEPNRIEDDGFEWFSREYIAKNVPEEHSKPAFMATEAVRVIEECGDRPLLLYLMFNEPHHPYTSPCDSQYSPEDVELPPNFEHDGFSEQPDRIRYFRKAMEVGGVTGVPGEQYLPSPASKDDWRELIANYWGLVSLVDTHVGRVLDELERTGLQNDSAVVYTSDHGDMMGSHGLVKKMVSFQESIRVPLIIDFPEQMDLPDLVEHPFSHIDLVPTLLDTLDQRIPNRLQGQSWIPFLQGEEELEYPNVVVEWNGTTFPGIRDASVWISDDDTGEDLFVPHPEEAALEIFNQIGSDRTLMSVVSDPTRTIITPDGLKLNYRREGDFELYNLESDPYEIDDLSSNPEYGGRINELQGDILDWQSRTRDPITLF